MRRTCFGISSGREPTSDIAVRLVAFFAERLKVHLRDKGARHDLIDAVFSLGGQDDLALIVKRVDALTELLKTEDGVNLLAGIKRAQNILAIEEKKDKTSYAATYEVALLKDKEELALAAAIESVKDDTRKAIDVENFAGAMRALAELRAPVDAFFDSDCQRRGPGAAPQPPASPVGDPRRHPQRRRLHQDRRLDRRAAAPGAMARGSHAGASFAPADLRRMKAVACSP